MSSYNCSKCHKRIWDKDTGYIGGTYEIRLKRLPDNQFVEDFQILKNRGASSIGNKTIVVCGFCGDRT